MTTEYEKDKALPSAQHASISHKIKPDTMIVLHTATQLDITGYTQDERDSLHERLRDIKNQKDWLQIYCALIASPGESTIEKAVQDTDTFYGAYQKRWAD